ncbi:MAG: tannase/feruloyl esterase family alpha/beta hydrolase [Caldimonas sp.]
MNRTNRSATTSRNGLFGAVCGTLLALAGCSAMTSSVPVEPQTALIRCEDLRGFTVGAADIGLPSSGATVLTAERLPELAPFPDVDGEHLLPTAPRCLVQGRIAPRDAAAPPINFAVNLPLRWNGRALQSGGGGLGGVVITSPQAKGSGRFDPIPLDRPYPLTLGYATFGSDGGHQGADTTFLRSDEALRNWGGEELKKTHDVALKVIAAAYGRMPSHTFFNGESAGGREAMMAAQRYAEDYDGIIATSPVLTWTYIHLADNHLRDRLVQGWLDAPAIKLVAERTRSSCDMADGLADGIIARYLECANDVAALRCPDGKAGATCLSEAQIASVNAIREPWSMAVPMADGLDRYAGYGVTGDEDGARYQYDFYPVGKQPPSMQLPVGRGFEAQRGAILNFAGFWIRHAIVQDPAFNPYLFDPRPHAARIQYLSSLFDATNPDLSAFARRGGKLILLQPSADNAVGLPMVAEYYRGVVRRMGPKATDGTMRFYVAAGGSHNANGPSQVDTLSLLENWVLKGEAPPDSVVGHDLDPTNLKPIRSMPVCRYPMYPRYKGSGDPRRAESFACTARPDPLEFAPAR